MLDIWSSICYYCIKSLCMKNIVLLVVTAMIMASCATTKRGCVQNELNEPNEKPANAGPNRMNTLRTISEVYGWDWVQSTELVDFTDSVVDGWKLNAGAFAQLKKQSDAIEDQIITIYPYSQCTSYGDMFFELKDGRIGYVRAIYIDGLKRRLLDELYNSERDYTLVGDFTINILSKRKNVYMKDGFYYPVIVGTAQILSVAGPTHDGDYDREMNIHFYVSPSEAQDIANIYWGLGTSMHAQKAFTAKYLRMGNGKKPFEQGIHDKLSVAKN